MHCLSAWLNSRTGCPFTHSDSHGSWILADWAPVALCLLFYWMVTLGSSCVRKFIYLQVQVEEALKVACRPHSKALCRWSPQSTARAEETSIPNPSTMVDTNPFDPEGLEHNNGSQSAASAEETSIPNPPTVPNETNLPDPEGPEHHDNPAISALANALHHPTPPVNSAPMDEQIILPALVLDASGDEIRESFGVERRYPLQLSHPLAETGLISVL
ncbi:hypothetical protein M404DRAFT_848583 [Pisolithus tinctorius Marx 270]|uniref:Uncharacterized protein n=1 Tax=Pisolithus tinctorius Marx 270 TaxID=870435 RepID=A0A0C3JLV4_PISTI|nr:hypothetical protein M404DRAFT_848583 [Pisolithus tinctorius Marx 270]